MSDNLDVRRFHERFHVPVRDLPQALEASELDFRVKFMQEELDEYRIGAEEGDLEKQFDALIDLVYVAHGTVLMHGFPWSEGWRRVQEKNMAKISAKDAGVTGRHAFDVVKPAGWTPPDHSDLVALTTPWPRERERKPRVIILEGPDGAGKSVLADSLEQLTGVQSIHLTPPVDEPAFDTCDRHIDNVVHADRGVIFDRFHISEHVYGPILRGIDGMAETGAIIEERLWSLTRPAVVMCLPPFDVALNTWSRRNAAKAELVEKREQYDAIYHGFESVRTTLPTIQYDYTRDSVESVLRRLDAIG